MNRFGSPSDQCEHRVAADAVVDEVARRLGTFGKRHCLSLGGMTIKELLAESRPRVRRVFNCYDEVVSKNLRSPCD